MSRSQIAVSCLGLCLLQSRVVALDASSTCAGTQSDDEEECALLQSVRHGSLGQKQRLSLATALIDEVYTFGAPATRTPAFQNAARKDGCFPGLRSYTEDLKGAKSEIHQVDAASMNNFYPHAYTSTVVLHEGMDSTYVPCNGTAHGEPEWPSKRTPNFFEKWSIHQEDDYTPRLNNVMLDGKKVADEEPFATAKSFLSLAWRTYDTFEDQTAKLSQDMPDWKLVAEEVFTYKSDTDPVILMQHTETLDCALTFTGTNEGSEYATSTTQHKSSYCGFDGVHAGYAKEIRDITKHTFPKLKPKLAKCSKVAVVGHSLGGALAEMFTACANSGHTSEQDYKFLAWEKGAPSAMDAIDEIGA